MSPIFIGFLAFPGLSYLGRQFFLHLVEVMIWPLGWGAAGLITEGMIDFMTDRTLLQTVPILGQGAYSLQNLMGVAFMAIWIIFSTIAAPLIIQKMLLSGGLVGTALLGGAFGAGRAAIGAGVSTLANSGTGAGTARQKILAGRATIGASIESLMGGSLNEGGGSVISNLASQMHMNHSMHAKPVQFPKNDPTGAKTVENSINQRRNS